MKMFVKSSTALAVTMALSSPVLAQDSSNQEEQVEKIVVTGQKLATTLQDTKESVVVLTESSLLQRNIENLTDVFLQTPGITGNQYGFKIRGVRDSDGASQPNRGDLASLVIDGVTVSGWVKSDAAGQLWDVNQLEVLRGPQSTNLGRNALAGALVINTNDPTFENSGRIRVGAGEYGRQELKGTANINLVDGVSAIRLSAEQSESDGYVTNITRNEDDYGHADNNVYRLKWLYQPSDELRAVLSYQHIESRLGSDSNFVVEGYTREDRITSADETSLFNTDADIASLNVDYTINDEWSLKSITAYQSGERDRFNDSDQTAASVDVDGGVVSRFSEDNNWSQEFRFNYESDTVRGSSGVFISEIEAYRSQSYSINYNLPVLFDEFSPGLGAILTTNAVLPVALYNPIFGVQDSGITNVDTSIWALFSEWQVDLSDQWLLSAGIRFDNEEQGYVTASNSQSDYVVPQPGGPLGGINLGVMTVDQLIMTINPQINALVTGVPEQQQTKKFDNILPHAGVTYTWSDELSSSFFVKKSYRSGGSELTLLNGVNNFDAEELWNYEGSLRAVMFDGKGTLNVNAYYSDWTKQQVAVQEPGTSNNSFVMTENAGKSELSGLEVSFDYEINDTLSLYSGFAISKTEYVDFDSIECVEGSCSGNEFIRAPEQTASLGLNYRNDMGLFINATASYTGEAFADIANTKKMKSYTLLNVNGGYAMDDIVIEGYVRNLTDEDYDLNNNITTSFGDAGFRMGAPREAGVRLTYSF